MTAALPDLVGSSEACAALGVHPSTLSRWVESGKLQPFTKLPSKNGAFMFLRSDIEALATERAS